MTDVVPNKSLGQHWLKDDEVLSQIADLAEIKPEDIVLEIGPGLGTLTKHLTSQAKQVIAVEFDKELAKNLLINKQDSLEVINEDILRFDFSSLPSGYKVVANIPYYLTSNLLRVLSESTNPPSMMVLLVQKEVAERICASPGQFSLLAVSVQLYYVAKLSILVPADLFTPPPKVDSQVVVLTRHDKPLFSNLDTKKFFQIVRAGFSGKRKKLRSSLSAGLGISKQEADELLIRANVNGDLRAQNLTLQDWYSLSQIF